MHAIHWIDYTIIIIYFLFILAIGLVMTRKASSSLENYFLGGRSMPWYMLGIAGMTQWFDMTGTMIITSFLYMLGPRGLYIEFRGGAVLVLAFLLCYAGKWHRRSGCMTPAEWMSYRFGPGGSASAVRLISAVLGIIGTIGMLAYLVRGTSLFLGMFFPWSPTTLALIIVGVTTLYTMASGFYGVILTDVAQGVIIMVACVLVGLIGWHLVPDSASLGTIATKVTGNADWTSSALNWHTSMPKGYEPYQMLFMFAMFYLIRNVLGGMGSGAEPRYFGARNDRECGLQSLLQGLTVMLRWPMMIGFAVMGIYLVAGNYPDMAVVPKVTALIQQFHPNVAPGFWHDLTSQIANQPQAEPAALINGLQSLLGANWPERLQLIGSQGTINPERILPAVLMYSVPVGLKGFLLVAMFAAMMSTFTGTVNGASALVVKDVYQNFVRPRAGDREMIILSYAATLIIVAIGFWMGIAASSINKIWGWIIMSFGAGGLAPGLLRLYWWRFNAWGVFGGLLLGCTGCTLQLFLAPDMVEWQQFLLMGSLSFVGSLIGTYAAPPTPMAILRHFYATTRPFGLWGPVLATFPAAERHNLTREHRSDIMAVPFALLWQVSLFLLPMQLVIKSYGSFWRTLPLFVISAVGMYWYWWRNLDPDTAEAVPLKHSSAAIAPVVADEPAGIA
jgi:Na+/proline symporter